MKNYFKIFNFEQCFKGLLYSKAVDVNMYADTVSKTFYFFSNFELRYLSF